jgi:hypothetical protein
MFQLSLAALDMNIWQFAECASSGLTQTWLLNPKLQQCLFALTKRGCGALHLGTHHQHMPCDNPRLWTRPAPRLLLHSSDQFAQLQAVKRIFRSSSPESEMTELGDAHQTLRLHREILRGCLTAIGIDSYSILSPSLNAFMLHCGADAVTQSLREIRPSLMTVGFSIKPIAASPAPDLQVSGHV